jgi:hypothetical protein
MLRRGGLKLRALGITTEGYRTGADAIVCDRPPSEVKMGRSGYPRVSKRLRAKSVSRICRKAAEGGLFVWKFLKHLRQMRNLKYFLDFCGQANDLHCAALFDDRNVDPCQLANS